MLNGYIKANWIMCARGNPQSGVRWHPAVPGHLSQLIKPPQELPHVSSSEVPSGTHILKSATSACDSGSYSSVPCGNISVLTFIIGFHFLEQSAEPGKQGGHESPYYHTQQLTLGITFLFCHPLAESSAQC